jgi:hypothetical protein
MRRALALMIALVLPLKGMAAVVVPIVGSPNHQHAAHAQHAQVAQDGPAAGTSGHHTPHAACEGSAEVSQAAADTLHDHACPHLAMVMMAMAAPTLEPERRTPPPAVEPARAPASVVLDLPVPPPTRSA